MKRLVLIALAGACLAPVTGHAQRISPMQAGNFARVCSKPAGASVCDAYITGMADAGALAKINDKNEGDANAPAGFCIPASENVASMRSKVISWLKGHSDSLSKPVGESVFRALHDSYPCSATK